MTVSPLDQYAANDGFTLRALLLAAAGTATEEDDVAVRTSARAMLARFDGTDTPRLTPVEREAYGRVVDLAAEYERGNLEAADMPDEPTEEERLAAAVAHHPDAMRDALAYLTA